MINRFWKNRNIPNKNNLSLFLFISILFIPLFFLNIKNSHDWGGDFALYIHQAKNFAEGVAQEENGYIFNKYFPLAPKIYPVGFPLLLSPVYLIFGNNMLAFNYYMSFLLFCLALILVYFFRQHFSLLISVIAVLVIIYNPWMLAFKTEIIADIPFTLVFIIGLIIYARIKSNYDSIIPNLALALIAGFLILIKSIGIIFLIALIIDSTFEFIKSGKTKTIDRKRVILRYSIPLIALLFYFFVNKTLITKANEPLLFFPALFNLGGLKDILLRALSYYIENFQNFFQPDTGKWIFTGLILKAFALSFLVLGFIISCIRKPGFYELLLLGFLLAILTFPNLAQGFRYLLPVLPLMIFYIIRGLMLINLNLKLNPIIIILIIGSFILIQYKPGIIKIIREKQEVIKGPFEPDALETWNFIKRNTPINTAIAFVKPTVLALYGERKSIANHYNQDFQSMSQTFRENEIDYFLINKDLNNQVLEAYIQTRGDSLELIYNNSSFKLYKEIH